MEEEQVLEEVTQEAEVKQEEKPAGYNPVDVKTATPEEIEARIKHLYGQNRDLMKETRASKKELSEIKAWKEQLESRQEVQAVDTEITHLMQQRKEARMAGDDDRVDEINDKIAELKSEKKLAMKSEVRSKPEENEEEIDQAVIQDMQAASLWGDELSDDGTFLRPWAQRSHKRYSDAISELNKIYYDPANANKTIEEKLAILERKMSPKTASTNVLGKGNAPRTSGDKAPQLTADQKKWADRMYERIKDPNERYKRYAESLKRSA